MTDQDDLQLLSKEELIDMVRAGADAGVTISFPGKAKARQIARKVRPRVPQEIKKYSAGSEDNRARNLLIEGDNLQALTTLFKQRGQVDLIIADPPYNTGNDFRYSDRWDENPNDTALGDLVGPDDPAKHTKWMKFMYPRLQMMKSMLKPGGILAICIDQRELFHLGQMLDEKDLFGEQNRIAIINWQKSYAPRSDKSHVSTATEYVLVYAKDEERARTTLLPRTDAMDARYKSPDGDPRVWKSGDLSAGKGDLNQPMVYAIQNPFTGKLHYPPEGNCWRLAQRDIKLTLEQWGSPYKLVDLKDYDERARAAGVSPAAVKRGVKGLLVDGDLVEAREKAAGVLASGPWPKIYFGMKGSGVPQHKRYLEDVKRGVVPMTYWSDEDHDFPHVLGSVSWNHEESGHSQTGVDELSAIVGRDHGFKTVKPLRLIQKLIQIWCPNDGLVLDPFAGSGTTGHAVLSLNYMLGATRQFIAVEQGRPEKGDSYARTLTADRLQRVISGDWVNERGVALGGGYEFRHLTQQVDAQALLDMERDEMVDTVVASYFDSSRRRGVNLQRLTASPHQYLVAKNSDGEGFYLIWDGPTGNTDFTEEVYEACVDEGEAEKLKPVYHVYARYNLFSTEGVKFYPIPDRILADFGLDVRTESYADTAEESA